MRSELGNDISMEKGDWPSIEKRRLQARGDSNQSSLSGLHVAPSTILYMKYCVCYKKYRS